MLKGFAISDIHIDHIGNGHPSREKILRYLEHKLCPADVIFVGGDISDSASAFSKLVDTLSELYPKVVYCLGNHDYAVHSNKNETSFQKIDRAVNGAKSTNAVFLDGGHHDLSDFTRVGGTMGAYDMSYSEKHFGLSYDHMLKEWNNWYDGRYWDLNGMTYTEFMNREIDKIDDLVNVKNCNIMLTHIGPLSWGIPPRFHTPTTGFFYFDGQKFLDAMPSDSVWIFGHTHDQKILDLGNVRLLCNPLGYPGELRSTIPKEEFLFDII